MVHFSLLLIAILTVASTGAAPIYCSDVQSPASGSHNTDLLQVISLQYCIIDNCTIMKIDTGEQLNIVYTTESLLIVTPINGLTSMVIIKVDDELPCLKYHNRNDEIQIFELVGTITIYLPIIMVSIYILLIHLLFKELRTMFGKLLTFYNLCIVSANVTVIAHSLMHYWIIVNSQIICHTVVILFMISYTGEGLFATTILAHLAYVMYRCYNLKSEISSKNKTFLFRCYTAYVFITLILLFFVAITYDWRTENSRYTLLPNGHCNFIDSYNTLFLSDVIVITNKFVQITMLSVYLVYFYKFKMAFRDADISIQYNKMLFRIAIAMGATIGLSHFIWMLLAFEYSDIISISGTILLLIQQIVIMTSFMCTRKITELFKVCFSRN